MDRRKAMKVAAGAIAAGGAGLLTLTTAFKPEKQPAPETKNLDYTPGENEWEYFHLDPAGTAQLAYDRYSEGSCMYATVVSVVSQLADKFGEPFASFPIHMFKYGHGGIGGFGSVCGALNGAAALIGLLITDKSVQDKMITDLFQWYESESLPNFSPANPVFDFTPVTSTSNSVLCHASNTNWCKASGFTVGSNERKERCRRLTGDVAQKVTALLNDIYTNAYITNTHSKEAANTCMVCHGNDGKVKNTSVKMSCTSCHTESVGHKIFGDVHYKFMKEH
jgi:hypothetical protein